LALRARKEKKIHKEKNGLLGREEFVREERIGLSNGKGFIREEESIRINSSERK